MYTQKDILLQTPFTTSFFFLKVDLKLIFVSFPKIKNINLLQKYFKYDFGSILDNETRRKICCQIKQPFDILV